MGNTSSVVEDDADLARMLCRVLGHDGYRVASVSDGSAALAHIAAHPVDLLITDLMMPGMEGEELLTALRAQRRRLPVILLSASAVREQVARRLRVDASLAKPFELEEVRQLVATLLDGD